jgi:hypothetical protein
MVLEVLVEEPSMQAALQPLLPRLVGEQCTWNVRNLGSKQQLLAKLPARLRAYAAQATMIDLRVLVLVDRDAEDCLVLKQRLETAATNVGLTTRTTAEGATFRVCNRIVVEELEAWFLADQSAMQAAYPKVRTVAGRRAYRDPDNVAGGTWEALERLLQHHGYHAGGLAKVQAARDIAPHLDLDNARSRSFAAFVHGVRSLVGVAA